VSIIITRAPPDLKGGTYEVHGLKLWAVLPATRFLKQQ
jgi:hypothetical protein